MTMAQSLAGLTLRAPASPTSSNNGYYPLPLALARWNAGERDVVFPAGTVRMRLRHNVMTEPVPLDLLLAA